MPLTSVTGSVQPFWDYQTDEIIALTADKAVFNPLTVRLECEDTGCYLCVVIGVKEGKAETHSTVEPCQALLGVSESIAAHRDLPALFHDLAERLPNVVSFDFLSLILHDASRNVMRLHVLESRIPASLPTTSELPVEQSPGGLVWETQEPLVVRDVEQETRFPFVMQVLRDRDIRSLCMLPLTTAQRRLGALGVGSQEPDAYNDAEIEFLQLVARQVAVAVDNLLNYQDAQSYQRQLARERDRLHVLLEINNALVSNLDRGQLFSAISRNLRQVTGLDYISLAILNPETDRLRLYALDFSAGSGAIQEGMEEAAGECLPGRAIEARKPVLLNSLDSQGADGSPMARLHIAEGLKSACFLPLINRDRVLGTLNVASLHENAFAQDDLDLLTQVANQIAIALDNALAFGQIAELKEKLAEEKLYLEDEIRSEHNFAEIVGDSGAWRRVLGQAETVAPTDSTVLILGETGTGKELIARAIHNLSGRCERTFVKINCAAIPSGLLESELFGHERGAFTGAITQKIGRFELAHQGTLFLDEVGDIPEDLQPKLLRVLQEQEFERLGSARTLRVDVRVLAATNHNLAQMVAEHRSRSDLYYRLNVFPILLPALHERREDIPALVRYFAQKYARRMNKLVESIPNEAMEALTRYHWPGNVRELENIIERAVILTPGSTLRVPLSELKVASVSPPSSRVGDATIEAVEREHILRTLKETKWVIGGPNGAAERLGMKRTTLSYRMKKLGLRRPRVSDQ